MAAVSDDAELVVSELVTNALRHGLCGSGAPGPDGGGQVVGLRLMIQAPHLICMVTDPSREIPLRRDSDLLDATGRGLCVIESCSSRWGWRLLDGGWQGGLGAAAGRIRNRRGLAISGAAITYKYAGPG